ncbi:hypothetical protein Salat_2113400 [Sesamum alatum]|uniref:Uncharacterized protein n=1 Tax=Sesamum alatum TaxID=300844 RepID=A0AAE1Y0S3_9LAMI|nr:hypothetical protein Salat_2113400 [Sesamum alatum]
MEATFVDSLVQHQQNGSFHHDRVNYHAVLCSIYDVNKEHLSRHSYATGQNKLKKLKERHALFNWLLTLSGWVDDYPPPPINEIILANIGHLNDTSIDSTSLWHFFEEYYASDDEEVESMVGIPGFESPIKPCPAVPPFSPPKLCIR